MTKNELKEYRAVANEIEIIKEKLEYLEEKKTSVKSQVISDMPRSSSENERLSTLLAEIEEVTELYNEKMSRLIKSQFKIENTIDILDDATERNLMRLKYLDGFTWEEVAVEMGYSWQHIHRIHNKILKKIRQNAV